MSRLMLVIGLIVSTIVHVWVLRLDGTGVATAQRPTSQTKLRPVVAAVDVVDVPQMPPTPTPKVRQQEPQPQPEPPEQEPRLVQVRPKPQVQEPQPPRPEPPLEPKPQPVQARPAPQPLPLPPASPAPTHAPDVPMQEVRKAPALAAPTQGPGDLAGAVEGDLAPQVRIQWGSFEQAMRVIRTAGMRLVALGPDLRVREEVTCGADGRWHRGPLRAAGSVTYSNGLRVVDQVPAFRQAYTSDLFKAGERLAVLVPVGVEAEIERAKNRALSEAGLSMKQINVMGGLFECEAGRVAFKIDKIQKR